jgi:hypothetical protein
VKLNKDSDIPACKAAVMSFRRPAARAVMRVLLLLSLPLTVPPPLHAARPRPARSHTEVANTGRHPGLLRPLPTLPLFGQIWLDPETAWYLDYESEYRESSTEPDPAISARWTGSDMERDCRRDSHAAYTA